MAKRKQISRPSKLERVAYHEAGHAVAAVILRRPFKYATVVENEDADGHVRYFPGELIDPETVVDERRAITKMERAIQTAFAGFASEQLAYGGGILEGSSDWEKAATLGLAIYTPGDLLNAYLRYLYEKCKAMLAEPLHREAIQGVVDALLEKKTLKSSEVRSVVKDVKRSVVERSKAEVAAMLKVSGIGQE